MGDRLRKLIKMGMMGGGESPGSFLTDFVGHWNLNETTGSRASSIIDNPLLVSVLGEDIGSASGRVGNGASFVAANKRMLKSMFKPALTGGSFEITFWIKFTTSTADQRAVSADNGTNARSFGIKLTSSSHLITAFGWFGAGAGTLKAVNASTFGAVSNNVLYFVDVAFDSPNHSLGISINRGVFNTVDTVSTAHVVPNTHLTVGGFAQRSECVDGVIDELHIQNRLLTDGERDKLYGGGNGWAFPASAYPIDPSAYPVTALPTFTRYAGNPIIEESAAAWESVCVANPDVFWDTPNNRYVMNYSGWDGSKWRTGLAYSTDLLTWTKEAANPVFGTNPAETYIESNGSIVLFGGTYYLYFHGTSNGTGTYVATSPDLINWTVQNGGNPIVPSPDPAARVVGSTVELYVMGGLYTSTNGINFTQSTSIQQLYTGEPYPLLTGATRYLADARGDPRKIGVYGSADSGVTWWNMGDILLPDPGEWDATNVFDPCLIVKDDTLYMFYAGYPGGGNPSEAAGMKIGVATAPWSA